MTTLFNIARLVFLAALVALVANLRGENRSAQGNLLALHGATAPANTNESPLPAPAAIAPGAGSVPAAAEALATPFTQELLLAALTKELAGHFNLEGELQLELIRPWTPPARIAAGWTLQVLEFPLVASATMMVRCRVLADAAAVAETSFVVRASHWREAWVTRQPLTVGGLFDPALLETRRVDLLRERDALPAAVGDRSYIFARAVPAGRLLTWRDIGRRPLVKKGEIVEVSAVDGALALTLKAIAMENGAQGDMVTVRNQESRKDFAAVVVDENRVQVRF
jgi:flagella basal body P-ring formation protein FlgA